MFLGSDGLGSSPPLCWLLLPYHQVARQVDLGGKVHVKSECRFQSEVEMRGRGGLCMWVGKSHPFSF